MITHATTLCLTRLAPLAGITLPLEGDNPTTPRHLVTVLDALPMSTLQPLEVCGVVMYSQGRGDFVAAGYTTREKGDLSTQDKSTQNKLLLLLR